MAEQFTNENITCDRQQMRGFPNTSVAILTAMLRLLRLKDACQYIPSIFAGDRESSRFLKTIIDHFNCANNADNFMNL